MYKPNPKFSSKVKKYINAVVNFLVETQQYAEVDTAVLDKLALNLEIFYQCQDDTIAKGVTASDRYGNPVQAPWVKTMKQAQDAIADAEKSLGLSPLARKRLQLSAADGISELEKFIELQGK